MHRALALILLALPASAQTFAPATHAAMGDTPWGLVVQDLSGDGLLDIATANRTEITVSVRLGDGAGGFGPETTYALPGLIEATDVAAGDITGDGVPDLVACGNTGNSSAIVVVRGNGDGTFTAAVDFELPCCLTQMGRLRLVDLSGDGELDVAGGSEFGKQMYTARNDDGAFIDFEAFSSLVTPCTDIICPGAVTGTGAADLDEDGDVDLACTNLFEKTFVRFANDGHAHFTQAGHTDLRASPGSLLVADVDEDGHADALIPEGDAAVHFLAGDGNGGFAEPIVSPMTGGPPPFVTGPGELALADLDGDGLLDVAATHSTGSVHDVLVAVGDGAGSFGGTKVAGALLQVSSRLLAGDLDRDGRQDLVATEPGSALPGNETVALLLNATKPAPPWNDTGFALAGTLGAPYLMTFGTLLPGSQVTLSLSGALPGAPAVLVLGDSEMYARFKGGTMVPFPSVLLVGFSPDEDGVLPLSAHWPPGVPSNTLFGVQWWLVDAGGPKGLASSNGVLGLVP